MANKKTRFGLGMVFGALAGAAAALFLSPTTGKENREIVAKKAEELKKLLKEKEVDLKVKEIFGNTKESSKELFFTAKTQLAEQLSTVGGALGTIEKEKYMTAVGEVVENLKNEGKLSNGAVDKFRTYLMSDYEKLKVGLTKKKATKKKAVRKVAKKAAPKKKKTVARRTSK